MLQLGQKMHAWRWPFWPATVAVLCADIAISAVVLTGGSPAIGTVAVVVTFVWIGSIQLIGSKNRRE